MNSELKRLAQEYQVDLEKHFDLSVAFGIACVERVKHPLTDEEIIKAFSVGKLYVQQKCECHDLFQAADCAKRGAAAHAGSGSLEGSGNATVSVSHALAFAVNGKALEAAEYAANTIVYSYASYAVTDPSSYDEEYDWQVNKFQELLITFN